MLVLFSTNYVVKFVLRLSGVMKRMRVCNTVSNKTFIPVDVVLPALGGLFMYVLTDPSVSIPTCNTADQKAQCILDASWLTCRALLSILLFI